MKALVFHNYGSADELKLEEVARPVPKANEVLIRVHAASINDWDWGLLRGTPFINKLSAGYPKPKKITILGCDVAGRVEAVGKDVKRFKPGDHVFGDLCNCGFGAFAEYVCATENALTIKPASMSFQQAAAMPQAAGLALHGLLKGKIKTSESDSAQKILINGASGGAGSFAVQIAKSYGAEVTGVCRTGKLEFVKSLGADKAIDFQQEDFTKNGEHYDLIVDMMAFHSVFDYIRALSPRGIYVVEGGSSFRVMQIVFLGPLLTLFGNKKVVLLMHQPNKDVDVLIDLFESGRVKPVIDKCYPLSAGAEAMRHFGEGRKKGKVLISMEEYL